ncbi:chemotaxis protein [Alteromonas sp. 5E99-2]|uniref:methyl-accepting chemotaxis protein n=1 Tax=Alteromonas sp. 5E99-2 TaxID=2817683 RepID=UPI001A998AA8|nr:methyl-accepting chemotaxis protein [Alteromonas sp. 5E99-2]MBO1256500.1 chemotaxis protein [Alteromonas sp. 5E99-2]
MLLPWTLQGHKLFRAILVIQWVVTIVIGVVTGNVVSPAILGAFIVGLPLFLSFTYTENALSSHAVAIAVQMMTALHIHQSFGLVEIHFEIFMSLALLAVFRDWKVILSATAVIGIHHISFYVLQLNDAGVHIYAPDNINIGILLLHAFFAVAEGAVLMYMTKQAHEEGVGAVALSNVIKKVVADPSKLDLTVSISNDYAILKPFAELVSKLKQLIAISSETAAEVSNASEQILIATQELSRSITARSEEITDISNASNDISGRIQETSKLADEVSAKSIDTKARSENAHGSVNNTNKLISSLRGKLNDAAENSKELSEWSASIANAMNTITSISEQTNLLALNAAIESARAGEHGRGFAVVADEVRNLAINSKQNAENISGITSKLVENTNSTLVSMEHCVGLVDEAVSAADTAANDMLNIIDSVTQVSTNMTTISEAADSQGATSSTISARTGDAQKGAENEVVISQELEAQVSALSSLSEQMKLATLRFKVD